MLEENFKVKIEPNCEIHNCLSAIFWCKECLEFHKICCGCKNDRT